MALRDTSILWKILLALQVVGLLLALVGFGASNHVTGNGNFDKWYIGLWRACFQDCDDTVDLLKALLRDKTWLEVSKVMMGVSWGVEALVIGMTCLALVTTLTKLLGFITATLAFISAGSGVVGVAVLQVKAKDLFDDLTTNLTPTSGWAFYLFLAAQVIYAVCGVLHIIDSTKRGR